MVVEEIKQEAPIILDNQPDPLLIERDFPRIEEENRIGEEDDDDAIDRLLESANWHDSDDE